MTEEVRRAYVSLHHDTPSLELLIVESSLGS